MLSRAVNRDDRHDDDPQDAARSFDPTPAAVAAVGLASAAAVDPAGWFPFSVAKWWLVVVAVLLAFAVAAWRERFTLSPAHRVFAGLLIVITASAVVAEDGAYAWIGTPVRHLGVVAWWLFALAFVTGSILGRSREPAEASRRAARRWDTDISIAFVGAVVGLYTLWELLIGRPIDYASNSERLGGPFGSPAYLGAACCILLPATIGGAMSLSRRGRPVATVVSVAVVMTLTIAVVGSGSRAALVGVAAAAFTVVWVNRSTVRGHENRKFRWTMIGGALVGAVALVVAAVTKGWFERSRGLGTRVDEWALALRTISTRPLLGHGPEGYRIAAFEQMDDDYVRSFGDAVLVDRAHSGVLDMAAASGLLAALIYVLVLVIVGRHAVAAIRTRRPAAAGRGAAVIAYAVAQQLLFPIAEIDPLFWLLAGWVVADAPTDEPGPARSARLQRPLRRGASVVAVAVACVAGVVGVRAVAADRLAHDAVRSSDLAAGVRLADRSADLDRLDVRHALLSSSLASQLGTLSGVDAAITSADRAADIAPDDPSVRLERARLRALRASITGSAADRAAAEASWNELVAASPSCARCHLGAGRAAGERGDLDGALVSLERAADLGNQEAADIVELLTR